jgi:hypothetical protein
VKEAKDRSMSDLPDIPLSQEASDLLSRLLPRIRQRLVEVNRVPVSVLLWGPGIASSSPLAVVRADLRKSLRENGHAALYSEELHDPNLPYSLRLQQLAQAQEFDLIVSTPCTPGSIGEIHDFAADHRVNSKTLVFLNEQHLDGYSPQSLATLQTLISCQIEYYPHEGECTRIIEVTLDNVRRIREMKYILAGRF